MNFDLEKKLNNLIVKDDLDNAINMAESELRKIPTTDFHKILGKNILPLRNDLENHLEEYYNQSVNFYSSKSKGLFKGLFGKRETIEPKAFYCEMNGFTINYDRWYIDLFAFEKWDSNNWDWLSDFDHSSEKELTLIGFEDIQKVFEDIHENKKFKEPNIKSSYEICELIVILRLQELFKETYTQAKAKNKVWTKIPMFVTAHDYEMIYKTIK